MLTNRRDVIFNVNKEFLRLDGSYIKNGGGGERWNYEQ